MHDNPKKIEKTAKRWMREEWWKDEQLDETLLKFDALIEDWSAGKANEQDSKTLDQLKRSDQDFAKYIEAHWALHQGLSRMAENNLKAQMQTWLTPKANVEARNLLPQKRNAAFIHFSKVAKLAAVMTGILLLWILTNIAIKTFRGRQMAKVIEAPNINHIPPNKTNENDTSRASEKKKEQALSRKPVQSKQEAAAREAFNKTPKDPGNERGKDVSSVRNDLWAKSNAAIVAKSWDAAFRLLDSLDRLNTSSPAVVLEQLGYVSFQRAYYEEAIRYYSRWYATNTLYHHDASQWYLFLSHLAMASAREHAAAASSLLDSMLMDPKHNYYPNAKQLYEEKIRPEKLLLDNWN